MSTFRCPGCSQDVGEDQEKCPNCNLVFLSSPEPTKPALAKLVCPKCQAENQSDFRFCGKCGSKLTQICWVCGFEGSLNMQFCGRCGTSFAKAARKATDPVPVSRPGPARIVVVDDEPYITTLLKQLLENEGIEVAATNSAKEAVALVAKLHPSLIITDRVMPDMDGFELVKALRRNPDNADLKIIMLTVVDAFEDIRKSILLGADDYICKPFDPQELLWSVKRHLMQFHPWEEKKESAT